MGKLYNFLGKEKYDKLMRFISFRYYFKFKPYKKVKKILHMSTPLHGNMGDHAIVYATNKFISENFRDYKLIEIYREDINRYEKSLKKIVNEDDLIFLIGGGNMGNLWIDEELDRRHVISMFPKNKIISMPQTISFTEDKKGEQEFEITKRVYNMHTNLTIIAREKKSYNIMKQSFNNANVILNPDTVLYLNDMFTGSERNRNRIMTCLRNDKESILGDKKNYLIDELNRKYNNVFNYDTVIDKRVTKEIRERELMNMFDKFLSSKVVITDRLHGMVFSAITKTPCIVTKSLDHKVTGTYEWIKDLNYIRLLDDFSISNIESIISELLEINKKEEIDFKRKYFYKLEKKLKAFNKV